MPMNELLSEDRIVILAEPGDRGSVLDIAARLLGAGSSSDAAAISAGLTGRERLASTAIGHGVAIPHSRIAGIEKSVGVFLRLDQPVDFGSADGVAVDLVFAMAVPEHFVEQHLQQLAELAERFAAPEFRQRLRRARNVPQLAECLIAEPLCRSAA